MSTTIPAATKPDEPGVDLAWLASKIPYSHYQQCVHCGLCTASCPTYLETSDENDSPRGRIYLMRAIADGRIGASAEVRHHLELCLDCRACESACPSGVPYGQIIEPFKIALHASAKPGDRTGTLQRLILHHLFPHASRVKTALAPARLLQKFGVLDLAERVGFTNLLPPTLRRLQAMLPTLQGAGSRLPTVLPPLGQKRARVALFKGCVADAMFPETNAATARVLQANGCEVVTPQAQGCCGAIHYHSGSEAPALDFARKNIVAFDSDRYDAIIVNAAGCGAMLKDYGHLLPAGNEAAKKFAAKVRDISEFLVELGPIAPRYPLPLKVTYHHPCHLCHAQQVRNQPLQLLGLIPGLQICPARRERTVLRRGRHL